jgi:hypothetical protein
MGSKSLDPCYKRPGTLGVQRIIICARSFTCFVDKFQDNLIPATLAILVATLSVAVSRT